MFRSARYPFAILILTLFGAVSAQAERPAVHPLLQPLIAEPDQPLPPVLRSSMAGQQGRKKISKREALDLHLRTTASRETLEDLGIEVRTLRGGRATVTALPSQLAALSRHPDIQSISLPRPVFPNLSASTSDMGIETLRSQSAGFFTGATGSGVVIGVVDSGIDVDHPNFMDASGNTRILYAYDQDTSTECTNTDIDGGTCTIVDESNALGHGTHVTGIAAGNGAAADENSNTYSHVGVAPEANIIFVKTDLTTVGIIDGINYIFDKADLLGLPAVVNLSLGNQLGAHDGTDSMEEEIDALVTAQDGRAVVVAAGNDRGDGIHAEISTVAAASVVGPAFTIDSYTASPGSGDDVLYVAGYYPETDNLTVHLWSPNGHYLTYGLNTTSVGSPCTVSDTSDGYIYLCNNYVSQLDQSTSDREIIVLVYDDLASSPPATGTWQMALTGNTVAGDGEVDFWTVSGLGGSSYKAYFSSHVDDSETLGIPATSKEAITVGAHITRACWEDYNGTPQSYTGIYDLGVLAPFSSAGPTRDGRVKPELAAPGMGIISALAHEVRTDVISAGFGAYVVNDDYLLLQGTSQAAPHVAGAVALLFEENVSYSNADIKSILRGSAREDTYTAIYDEAPSGFFPFGNTVNYSFGAGKLDLGPWAFNDPYETNDQAKNAYDILSGQTLKGYIEHAGDMDMFYLGALASGDTVNVDLTNLPDDYLLRLQARLAFGGSCGAIPLLSVATSDNSGTTDESISHIASWNLARYIRVASSTGSYDAGSPYDLKAVITRPETTSVHNSTATAQVLPDDFVEFKVAGSLSSGADQDYYQFKVTGSGTISLNASQRTLKILDSKGAVLSSGVSSTSYSPGLVLPGITRTYYAVVSASRSLSPSSYTLTLSH